MIRADNMLRQRRCEAGSGETEGPVGPRVHGRMSHDGATWPGKISGISGKLPVGSRVTCDDHCAVRAEFPCEFAVQVLARSRHRLALTERGATCGLPRRLAAWRADRRVFDLERIRDERGRPFRLSDVCLSQSSLFTCMGKGTGTHRLHRHALVCTSRLPSGVAVGTEHSYCAKVDRL